MSKQPNNFISQTWRRFVTKITAPVVGVVRLNGIVGEAGIKSGFSFDSVEDILQKAFKLPKAKAVVISINSPGGSPVQSELIFNKIRFLSEKYSLPVYGFTEDVAASGGYLIACAADEIYASENSIIGSIGVITSGFGYEEAIKKIGITRRIYTQGENKSVLDPFMPEKESDIELIKSIQKDIHNCFKNIVRTSRAGKLFADEEKLFNGEFWAGKQAASLGLIDYLRSDVQEVLEEKFGKDVRIIKLAKQKSMIKKLFSIDLVVENIVSILLSKVKERSYFGKFGL